MYPLGHRSHLENRIVSVQLSNCEIHIIFVVIKVSSSIHHFTFIMNLIVIEVKDDFLPITIIVVVVTPHPLEARPLNAGNDMDFGADPSVSGVTAKTGAALGSARCVTAIDAGVARRVMVARGRRRCWHYGITGITARITSELPIFGGFSTAGLPYRRAGPARTQKIMRRRQCVIRARANDIQNCSKRLT